MPKFNHFYSIFFVLFLLLFSCHPAIAEEVSLHRDGRHLTVTIKDKEFHFKNYFTRCSMLDEDVSTFNKKPALCSISSSRTHTEVYLTLDEQSQVPKIDCLYGYFVHNPTGIRTNIAVCGIDKNLTATPTTLEEYPDTQFVYIDEYLSTLYDIDSITQKFFAAFENGKKVRLEVASAGKLTLFYQLNERQDVFGVTVGIKDNEKEYLWEKVSFLPNYTGSLQFNGLSFFTFHNNLLIKTLSIPKLNEILSRKGKPLNPDFVVLNIKNTHRPSQ